MTGSGAPSWGSQTLSTNAPGPLTQSSCRPRSTNRNPTVLGSHPGLSSSPFLQHHAGVSPTEAHAPCPQLHQQPQVQAGSSKESVLTDHFLTSIRSLIHSAGLSSQGQTLLPGSFSHLPGASHWSFLAVSPLPDLETQEDSGPLFSACPFSITVPGSGHPHWQLKYHPNANAPPKSVFLTLTSLLSSRLMEPTA